ncbi:MAG TPA: ABC transporter substrate-binding protein [Dongiaceae bacterium]
MLALAQPPITPSADSQLDALIRNSMDWTGLTRFAVGRYREELDNDGMEEVRAQIQRQLGALTRRAGRELPGLTLAIEDMEIDPDGTRHVFGTATSPRFSEIGVEWILAPDRNGYRIVDIKALGLTMRVFLRSWVAGLIAAQNDDAAAAFESPATPSPQ